MIKRVVEIQDRILTDDEIFKEVATKLNLPKEIVKGAYMAWWRDMIDIMSNKNGVTTHRNVVVPYFGHLIPLKSYAKQIHYRNKKKKNPSTVQRDCDDGEQI